MATHKVLNIKNALVSVDGEEFGDAITSATLNISSSDASWVPVSGNTQSEVGSPEYSVTLDFGQDFTEGSLTHELFTRHGETATLVVRPAGGSTPSITATVVLKTPEALGGGVGIATSRAQLGVNGTPVIVWSAPGGTGESE